MIFTFVLLGDQKHNLMLADSTRDAFFLSMPAASHVYRKCSEKIRLRPESYRLFYGSFSINIQIHRICKFDYLTLIKKNQMANTFSQIYIQIVFAVQNRNALIQPAWEEELNKYITGVVQNKGQKMLVINGTKNHIHFL